jgi:uncharacterized Zn finger protein
MSGSKQTISQKAERWLNQFSDQVDFNRFQRGVSLFNKNSIVNMDVTPIGYNAKVIGSNNNQYTVQADFILNGEFPRLNDLIVLCSCSDDARICKHAVCTVFYYIMNLEKIPNMKNGSSQKHIDNTHSNGLLESFEKNISTAGVTVLNLPTEDFWPFEQSFNSAIKDIDSILSQILHEVRKINN